ncbi:MAG TPA: GDSL-type esterase/lipase family protein [Actinospica sp.]|nr:GDSL-type esterase/lipase family protein [Actinospica sp.]
MKRLPLPHFRLPRLDQRRRRRARKLLLGAVAVLVISTVSAWLALLVTPAQTVSTAGQTIQVGAAQPSLALSGPGELDLFGQSMPTVLRFDGLIRPKLALTHISLDNQLAQFVQISASKHNGAGDLSSALVNGWEHYFFWQTLIAGAFAVVLLLAAAGVRRFPHRTTIKLVAFGTVAALVINVGFVAAFAAGAPGTLRQVHSLQDLVGRSPVGAAPNPVGASLPGVQAVVLGDSTAAGLGNPLVKKPSTLDTACGRSADSYAADLASVNGWNVLNLACSGATVADGILGTQTLGTSAIAAPQFGGLEQASQASVVIVSIGANDLQWEAMAAMCAMGPSCDDQATAALFQANLASFTQDYYQLLHDLAALPAHPHVLINEYFTPFGTNVSCLRSEGMTAAKTVILLSRLATLNRVLAEGAKTFDFTAVQPDFTGHELCTGQPFVQGLHDNAPMHPNTAGELAIALADQQALSRLAASTAVMAESTGPQ